MNLYAEIGSFLGGFPANYLVFDCETQGIDPLSHETLITQIGYCLVENHQAIDTGAIMLDWARPGTGIDPERFRISLAMTRDAMAAKGKTYHTTWDRVQVEGHHPYDALIAFHDLLTLACEKDFRLAGFNSHMFDRRLIERCFGAHAGIQFQFPRGRMFDSGMFEKALGLGARYLPDSDLIPIEDWYEDIYAVRSRNKWSLDVVCSAKYSLLERCGLAAAQCHDAGADCLLTHQHIEALRELAAEQEMESNRGAAANVA